MRGNDVEAPIEIESDEEDEEDGMKVGAEREVRTGSILESPIEISSDGESSDDEEEEVEQAEQAVA